MNACPCTVRVGKLGGADAQCTICGKIHVNPDRSFDTKAQDHERVVLETEIYMLREEIEHMTMTYFWAIGVAFITGTAFGIAAYYLWRVI